VPGLLRPGGAERAADTAGTDDGELHLDLHRIRLVIARQKGVYARLGRAMATKQSKPFATKDWIASLRSQ
jgi:hypothetical protein